MVVLFHNTECGNTDNKLKGWLFIIIIIIIKYFSLRLHRFSLWCYHVINERLKPEDSRDELINSLSGSYCISHVMNERLGKPGDSKQIN